VASPKASLSRVAVLAPPLAYAAVIAAFLWVCAQFYLPGKGFTYLIEFGETESPRYLPELKAINHYEVPQLPGYDAQWYAQIAMHPQLGDPVLRDAVDSLPYRARRILFCWTAYALAFGDPGRALQIYAVQNIVCWLALALLLLRWFPPNGWGNFFRWAGVLLSVGMVGSVRSALVDGPSLLLIAAGVALFETGRPWWSAALLGIAGLGKETNVLAGAVLAPRGRDRGAWARALARGALVVLPLLIWLGVLQRWIGEPTNIGYRNFAPPFVEYLKKWHEVLQPFASGQLDAAGWGNLIVVVTLTVQFLFLALRPRPHEPWWRVGAAYGLLMVFLGEAVWEGYPGAAPRVLLPLVLVFNVLVPRGRRWWLVLLLGNLTLFLAPTLLELPPRDTADVRGPRALRFVEHTGQTIAVEFGENWYGPERSAFDSWRWSSGSAVMTVRNPQPFALRADVSFGLISDRDRSVTLRVGDREIWKGALIAGRLVPVALRDVPLAAGDNLWRFETDAPAEQPANHDPRRVAFSIRDLQITLTGRADQK
jgi:hypothetical protein